MPTTREDAFEIPVVYSPRIPWGVFTAIFLILALLELAITLRQEGPQVPLQFTWEGDVVRWADRSPLTLGLPFYYGSLAAALCLFVARRIRPVTTGMILPPTPREGFIDHLSRATAATLLHISAAHFACIAMVMQFSLQTVMAGAQLAGGSVPLNNIWVVAGYFPYLAYSAWILLVFNRDLKRGEYGEAALMADALVPPSVSQPVRATRRPARAKPITPATPRGQVD